ncbi:unnamed protein product [Prunus brigantina]
MPWDCVTSQHIDIDFQSVWDCVTCGLLQVSHVSIADQLADALTNPCRVHVSIFFVPRLVSLMVPPSCRGVSRNLLHQRRLLHQQRKSFHNHMLLHTKVNHDLC